MRSRLAALVVALTLMLFAPGPAPALPQPFDGARAVNIVPPGESGMITLTQFASAQNDGNYGPHFADQAPLYASFRYKPQQFGKGALWHTLGGSTIYKDAWGVPQIYAKDRASLYQGLGYAMASDRLFQMEIFRRVGHGTLAAMLGQPFVAMDTEVRTLSEGAAARAAELARDPQSRKDLEAFSAGINTYIQEATADPQKLPAEFALLSDLPIAPWTPDDTLAFGEYAGRFFGEWGHSELDIAADLARLSAKLGPSMARKVVNDLYPLDDPSTPTTIPRSLGVFPRHTARPASGRAAPVNITPASMGGAKAITLAAEARDRTESAIRTLQKRLGLTGFGSNQYIVTASHAAAHHPLLVSEPQTSLAAPSFFWEVEMHGGGFDLRGVTVPAIPLVVIGRNANSGWAVTSALDANSDTFVERLNPAGTTYTYGGRSQPIRSHNETIQCRTPPTAVVGLTSGDSSDVCKAPSVTITVRRSIHGPLITAPNPSSHVAFSRQAVVDGRIVPSLAAWTRIGQARTVSQFASAASELAFGFNFMYVGDGHAAYFHCGLYPIRPADVDPRFPIPGTGAWDWKGYERFADQPHSIDPATGFLANWNNKPAVGWISKPIGGESIPPAPNLPRPEINTWGPTHQVETIQHDLASLGKHVRFEDMASIEMHVASIDNRARTWMPSLLAAIDASGDNSIKQARSLLGAWNRQRLDTNHDGKYDAPGLAIFDRWVEVVLRSTFNELDLVTFQAASGVRDDGHYFSSNNQDVPTFKIDTALYATFTHALRRDARVNYFGRSTPNAALVAALKKALDSLKKELGSNPTAWREPAEHEPYPPQGAGFVPDIVPTLNRGSYGQIIEPGGPPTSRILVAAKLF